MEVGRWLSLHNYYFHYRLSAIGSCEMLSSSSAAGSGRGVLSEDLIPKSAGFRVGL